MAQPDLPFDRPYPTGTPRIAHSDTSAAAGDSVEPIAASLRRRVLIALAGGDATCDELEVALDMSHQTCSARVRELVLLGLVQDTGQRRKTRSGRGARVYSTA